MEQFKNNNPEKLRLSLLEVFLKATQKDDYLQEVLRKTGYLRRTLEMMRDNYYSHVLVRCYELKNKQEETCKYIINKVLSRIKNKSENDMIRDVVFSILGSRDKWLTLMPWF